MLRFSLRREEKIRRPALGVSVWSLMLILIKDAKSM